MREYLALQTAQGWHVARLAKGRARILSEPMAMSDVAMVCDLLNNIFVPDWREEHISLAQRLAPAWELPVWLPEYLRVKCAPEHKKIQVGKPAGA